MCLAIPGQIVSKEAGMGLIDIRGNRMRAGLLLVPEAQVGDWVLVHAGFAITQLTPEDAAETNALFDQMEDLKGGPL
ncbi:MAG TPA: HypC/HybG/HupF family hydrogenase formation chaperone [Phycisphaerae bacterium]|nr:HypC/HybG/HupF family hydrogenase formation chaperone [Phycisphaerae bacterium]